MLRATKIDLSRPHLLVALGMAQEAEQRNRVPKQTLSLSGRKYPGDYWGQGLFLAKQSDTYSKRSCSDSEDGTTLKRLRWFS